MYFSEEQCTSGAQHSHSSYPQLTALCAAGFPQQPPGKGQTVLEGTATSSPVQSPARGDSQHTWVLLLPGRGQVKGVRAHPWRQEKLHTHTAAAQQPLGKPFGFAELQRDCQEPGAAGSQQAGKPLMQGGEGEAPVGTSDSKPGRALAELCNEKKAFKCFMEEEIVLDLPLYALCEGKTNFTQQEHVQRRHRAHAQCEM